jgi:GT2 family glycosyltransferase
LPEKICIVIVTFNNAGMLEDLLKDLHSQNRLPDKIILIDNASRDQTGNMVKLRYPDVQYVRLRENLGSAGGYREGIRLSVDSGDFIYTLDDDVQLNPDTLSEIINGFHQLEEVSPFRVGAVRSVGDGHPERVPTRLAICPWRGTLFKTDIFREAGLPSPDYFLYGEDLEYSLRLAKKGYSFYWIPTSICRERRRNRDGKARVDAFGKQYLRYQDPFRLYYAFRNEIFIYCKYKYMFNLVHTLMYAMKVMLMFLVTEGRSGKNSIKAIVKGMNDGLKGKLGKNINFTPE